MARLHDQDPKHQEVFIGRVATFGPVAPLNRALQIGPEQFEIDKRVQPLRIIVLGR